MNFKYISKIIVEFIQNYWHMILVGICILWIILTYVASLTAWKAVFLDNTQVYFGHYMHIPFTRYATLREVYFLRAGANLEDTATIVPLATEPHGPENYMRINVDHVVAVHILRSDSPLVKTINGVDAQ